MLKYAILSLTALLSVSAFAESGEENNTEVSSIEVSVPDSSGSESNTSASE